MNQMDEPVYPGGLGQTIGRETSPGMWTQFQLPANEGISLRAYAAIHLRVPDSGIPELDKMIEKARRQEMVVEALIGVISTGCYNRQEAPATTAADAAIKAMEEKA